MNSRRRSGTQPHRAQRCFIGLGSNLNQPPQQLRRAVRQLEQLPRSQLVACSSIYLSAALGPGRQPDYLNAVAELHSKLPPHALLAQLQRIEQRAGRVRSRRWMPRPLDLDLLLYGKLTLRSASLVLPHPGIWQRNFVLRPLQELAPGLRFPDGRRLDEATIAACSGRLHKLSLHLRNGRPRKASRMPD